MEHYNIFILCLISSIRSERDTFNRFGTFATATPLNKIQKKAITHIHVTCKSKKQKPKHMTLKIENILEYVLLKFGDDSRRCVAMKIFSFQKLSINDGVIDFLVQ